VIALNALERIVDGTISGEHELSGMFDEDARYIYPLRERAVMNEAKVALSNIYAELAKDSSHE
jgi:hypothetical protein